MSKRSFHVRWILLGFLLSGGSMGLLAQLIPSAWLVPYVIVTVSTLCAAVATYVYFVFIRPRRSRAMVWTLPAKEEVDSSTPVSTETLAPAELRQNSASESQDDDALGAPPLTDEEWGEVITHAQKAAPSLGIRDIPLPPRAPKQS
jgi:hypothetical protein